MDIKTVRNSLRSVMSELIVKIDSDPWGALDQATDQALMIILVEQWDHQRGEHLEWHDLTDAEFRVCVMWIAANKRNYGDRTISMIEEMREIFPGLGFKAARDFVRGY